MVVLSRSSLNILFLVLALLRSSSCDQAGYDDDGHADDDDNEFAAYSASDAQGYSNYQAKYQSSSWNGRYKQGENIQYWTEFAILPKRCIVYNDVDVIVFSMHPHGYQKQCNDNPMGTYIAPVSYFVDGYLQDIAYDMQEQGYDYETPDVAQYVSCTAYTIQNQEYYLQLGCADDTSQALAVNIYTDSSCTKRSQINGYDDSNIDVSKIQLPFKKCQACVNWFDNAGDMDDQYFEQHQMTAPLCSTAWSMKQSCGRKCMRTGVDGVSAGWDTSDKILLAILTLFGFIMLGLIIRKRQKMSNKDALLEQAAMSAAGLQQPHVIGIFILVVLVVAVFALLGLKNITWALLLILNTALFGYLMKLTVDSGVSKGESMIGPDGQVIMQRESDDSSMEEESKESSRRNAGTFVLPTLT